MNKIYLIVLGLFIFLGCSNEKSNNENKSHLASVQKPSIIPIPVNHDTNNQFLIINGSIIIDLQTDNKEVFKYVEEFKTFLRNIGLKVTLNETADKSKSIVLKLNDKSFDEIGKEGYTLEINETTINLSANEPEGIFNGFQTLRQLFPNQSWSYL